MVETWKQRTEAPLMAAALLFLGAYAWLVLDPNLDSHWRLVCDIALWSTWALFAVDYLARLATSDNRSKFFARHIPDLVVVALPILRPLRLLRILALIGVLNQMAGRSLRGRVTIYVTGGAILIILLSALAVLDAERGTPDAQITSFGDSLWWAVVSTTTVGYGDLYPVTTTGRLVAVGLMITGIALLGTVTASIAAWLVETVQDGHTSAQSEIERLTANIRELHDALAAHQQRYP